MPVISLGPVHDGSAHLSAYLARPAGSGPWPGVVAIHEAWGLDDVLRRHADRLAAAGYLTLAPDLYSDANMGRCIVGTMRSMLSGHGKPYADIEAARRHLLAAPDCTGKVGSIGFCMGGGFALVTASSGFDATAVNYGALPRHAGTVLRGACPVVASYGGKDRSLSGVAADLGRTLDTLDVVHDIKEYPDAGHSFLNDAPNGPWPVRPLLRIAHVGPEPSAAKDAWARIEVFFGKQLR